MNGYRALNDDSADVRIAAAQALGQIGDSRAVVSLLECVLEDDSIEVQVASAEALGMIRSPQASSGLLEACNSKSKNLRQAAKLALGQLGLRVPIPEDPECHTISQRLDLVRHHLYLDQNEYLELLSRVRLFVSVEDQFIRLVSPLLRLYARSYQSSSMDERRIAYGVKGPELAEQKEAMRHLWEKIAKAIEDLLTAGCATEQIREQSRSIASAVIPLAGEVEVFWSCRSW